MRIRLLFKILYKNIREKWIQLNLFESRSTDPIILRREILSTRVYILLLCISFLTITIFTSITNQYESQTISSPDYSSYTNLQKKYSNSLTCSCTKATIVYQHFVDINALFHRVCSSDFISQQWIDFLFQVDSTSIYPIDIRTSLSAMWQLINYFCQSSITTVVDALDQFKKSSLISLMLLTEDFLAAKIQSTLNSLIEMVSLNFIQSISIVNKITHANQLMTALSTNSIPITEKYQYMDINFPTFHTPIMPLSIYVGMFENIFLFPNSTIPCLCKNNVSCPLLGSIYSYNLSILLGVYDLNRIQPIETFEGLMVDCLPIQTTFLSTLQCFYNRTCLERLLSFYPKQFSISVLNEFDSSRFNQTTKIELLITELFIEEIRSKIHYKEYYSQCKPNFCYYIHLNRFNTIYILTTLFGLLGGVTAVLRLIAPLIVQLMIFFKNACCSKKSKAIRQHQNEVQRSRLRRIYQKLESKLIDLNVYSRHSRDKIRVYHGVLSTWLYVTLLLISIIIIILFSNLSNQTINETFANPTWKLYQRLYEKYSTKLFCPCTQILVQYEDFTKIQVRLHQICSSDLIRPSWYENFLSSNSFKRRLEFLSFASSYFRTLAAFCDFANTTIHDSIQRFLKTDFVNGQLLSNHSFLLTMNSLIHQLIRSIRTDFHYKMSLTTLSIQSNYYVSQMRVSADLKALQMTNATGHYGATINVYAPYIYNMTGQYCHCIRDWSCPVNFQIFLHGYFVEIDWQLEGIYGGCSIVDLVLRSSMICWFKKGCLTRLQILADISKFVSVKALDPKLPSRYSSDSLIERIFDEMMVEDWNYSYSYEQFYHKCRPKSCSVTYERKRNILYIITFILSLIGGVNITLRMISPFIIKIIMKIIAKVKQSKRLLIQITREDQHQNNTILNRFNKRILGIKDKLEILNAFDSESNDIETIDRERISTRFYFFILIVSIAIIIIYTVYSSVIVMKSISNPSQDEYHKLFILHSKSLDCPCSKISIEYKHFMQIETRLHSVCVSDFIKREWRDYLAYQIEYNFHRSDLRTRGKEYFSFLSSLCQLLETTIHDAIDQFLNGTFINIRLISKSDFEMQINNTISQFQLTSSAKFSRSFQLIRNILDGNAFVSGHLLNWEWWRDLTRIFYTIPTRPIIINNECSCGTRSDCKEPARIFYLIPHGSTVDFSIPGWNIGCSVVETVLHSTLECFYDRNCTDLLLYHLKRSTHPSYMYVSPIDSSMKSRFQSNTTVRDMVDQLFVEEWMVNRSYSSFYDQCSPISCSYQIQRDEYVIYTISKVLGLYGGLTISLKLIIPFIIKIIFKIQNRFQRNAVVPFQ
ncbi:unnamed protein product [Adineta ricciae]|uniref:Uncharacterized protein n=1 Tax=Adineta ricciae TaxID=249248 RepID=A0A815VNA9_ADIRI|nr:unnamed protein product [Adineta ricciae]CAF1575066.1 unnamed protein product [Adineta ricciae]